MEPPLHDEKTTGDIESLKGKRISYYRLLKHFQDLLQNKYKNIDALIAAEFPKYSLSLGCSALHGTIHLGYGYSMRNERTVCEALAYLHHSYCPLVHKKPLLSASEFGKGSKDLLEILQCLRKDTEFHNTMINEIKQEPWRSETQGYFQRRLNYLIAVHGDKLLSLLSDLKMDVPKTEGGEIDIKELGTMVVDAAITVNAMTEPANDFFILHGVTCSWSLKQILPLLNNIQALESVEVFIIILMGTYVTQDCPQLKVALSEPGKVDSKRWDDLIRRTLAMAADEHVYKLVQVIYDMWKLNPGMGNRYLHAAETAISKPLHFIDAAEPS